MMAAAGVCTTRERVVIYSLPTIEELSAYVPHSPISSLGREQTVRLGENAPAYLRSF